MENLEYNELELKYLELFDKLPPEYVGVNKKHPIYLKMLQESIINNRELNLSEFEQKIKKEKLYNKEINRAEYLFRL